MEVAAVCIFKLVQSHASHRTQAVPNEVMYCVMPEFCGVMAAAGAVVLCAMYDKV
jgi:hypothetical protein